MRALVDDAPERASRIVSPSSDRSSVLSLPVARDTVQGVMSTFVGVTRSDGGLAEAATMLESMAAVLDYSLSRPAELELQNMITLAILLTHAARYRTESRGTHMREDHPARDDEHWRVHTTWRRGRAPLKVPVRTEGGALAAGESCAVPQGHEPGERP